MDDCTIAIYRGIHSVRLFCLSWLVSFDIANYKMEFQGEESLTEVVDEEEDEHYDEVVKKLAYIFSGKRRRKYPEIVDDEAQ